MLSSQAKKSACSQKAEKYDSAQNQRGTARCRHLIQYTRGAGHDNPTVTSH